MLVQTSICLLLITLGGVVNGNKPPQNEGSSQKTVSRSQSSSSSHSYSSSSSFSSSTVESTTPVNCHEDKCDRNSTYKRCPAPCPGTCENPQGSPNCKKKCQPYGCECKPGYVVSKKGKCIKLEDCPGKCDRNSTFKKCPAACPGTCVNPQGSPNCKKMCQPYGCECKPGYVVSENGKCVKLEDCPGKCDRNSTFKKCPAACPGTCENPQGSPNCKKMCQPYGCECKPGYVVSENGKCVKLEDCPGKCDRNSTFKNCPVPCPGTCENPEGIPNCEKLCQPYGCECKPGYVVSENGKCVKLEDCPGKCDRNSTFKKCPAPCPGTCNNPQGSPNCKKMCQPYGCECKPGYVVSENGKCIKLEDCPGKCDRNSTYKKCPAACPGTCGNPQGSPNCKKMCQPYGCECKPGYVVSENGKCVKVEDCPDYLRCNDRNATFKDCPNPCPSTCAFPGRVPCSRACVKQGCECKQGFYLNDENKCVALQDCPGAKSCSVNETFAFCKVGCPYNDCPKNDNRGIIACSPPFPCGSGCICKGDYLRNTDDRCILYSDCTPIKCSRPNEVYCARPPPCLFEDCTDIGKPNKCDRTYPNKPQCICKPGFFRNKDAICVPKKKCPKPPPTCGRNEVAVDCKTQCPPQSCAISYTVYICSKVKCVPGCDCLPNYLRNASGDCIPSEDCPPPPIMPNCKENEVPSTCKITCPPQTCVSLYTKYKCDANAICEWGCDCKGGYLRDYRGVCIPGAKCPNYPPQVCGYNEIFSECKIDCPPQTCDSIFTSYLCSNETVCEPGCNCLNGYLRNGSGICVPSKECSPAQQCDISPECRQTCANPEPNCRLVHLPSNVMENQDGCKCKSGYILSATNGGCIKIEDCPDAGCNGDPNSKVTACPWPCPSTCESPNAGSYGFTCDAVGCQCKPGFILSDDNGKCILPGECKCGNPCGPNGTFSECAFRCPNQNCPKDDSNVKVACKPGRPCPSGCICKPYYLRSNENGKCVLASDCTPVTCKRPNEKWDPYASECLAESCDDLITTPECYPDPKNYKPQCVCCEGYARNKSGVCVPKEDCPITCEVKQECRPTCAVPNPPNCPFITPSNTNVDTCNCQSGYVLSEAGGRCIKIGECPANQTCNGDPHATIKECPLPCHSTCESPNAFPCKRKCDPIGCECKPGYLKSETGRCILPDECKGGNPCGQNETFTACRYQCKTNYCPTDDSRAVVVCEESPFSGCSCRLNYRRRSIEDPRCILASECCPVKCTRQNEKWNSCPSDCGSEYCEAVDSSPVVCNTLVLNCNPRCECKKNYFRNDTDICVSARECRKLNKRKRF